MSTAVRLAVDLGTTHTVAVVARGDQRPRALLFDGSPLLPSGVFLDAHGTIHTGRDAQRFGAAEPDRFEPHPKRCVDDGAVLLGGSEIPVEDLLAAGLRRVADEADASGLHPTDVVLTHPADWGPQRRAKLRRAAAAAGLGDVRLVDEPVAAATYCVATLDQDIPDGGSVAIFDFGGGTLDVAVVRRDADGALRTLAVGGLDDLGGLDIDNALVAHLGRLVAYRDPGLWARIDRPATAADRRDRTAFWNEVRAAKEMLARTSTAPVAVPGHDTVNLHLTRDELTSIADPLIARAVDECRRTVERAGIAPSALAMLLLVGGSSRMPQVATRLHERLGIAPSVPEQPELPVAYGALLCETSDRAPSPTPPAEPAPTPPSTLTPVAYTPYPVSPQAVTSPPPFDPTPPAALTAPLGPATPPRRKAVRIAVGTALAVAVAVTLAVVVPRYDWRGLAELPDADGGGIGGDLIGGDGAAAAELVPRFDPLALGGSGAKAVTAAGELAIIAEVDDGQTTVTALDATGGEVWSASYEIEPTELALTVVEGLLVVDAVDSATDEGVDVRAVVDLGDGTLLWKAPWENRLDVAYYGTHAIVEQRQGFNENAVKRIDLATGEAVWNRSGPNSLFLLDSRRITVSSHWNEGAGGAGTGVLPPSAGALYDNLVAGDRVVDLDPDNGTGSVRRAGNGDVTVSGALPLDDEQWTVYEGLVIGKLSDRESPGRHVLAAYALSNLGEAWTVPFDAGSRIERVKACGPGLVCVAVDHTDDDRHMTVAVDVESGEEAWTVPAEWTTDEGWYVGAAGLVHGDHTFDTVDGAQLLDFAGAVVAELPQYSQTAAVRDGFAALYVVESSGDDLAYWLSVADMATGESATAAVAAGTPERVVVADGVVVVLTDEGTVTVLGIPAAMAAAPAE